MGSRIGVYTDVASRCIIDIPIETTTRKPILRQGRILIYIKDQGLSSITLHIYLTLYCVASSAKSPVSRISYTSTLPTLCIPSLHPEKISKNGHQRPSTVMSNTGCCGRYKIADIGPSALAKLYFVPRTDGNSSASLNPLAHGWHRRFSSNAANFSI